MFPDTGFTLAWQHLDAARNIEASTAIMRGGAEPIGRCSTRSSRAEPSQYHSAANSLVRHVSTGRSHRQTIMTHIVRLAPGRSPACTTTTRTTTAGTPTRARSKSATPRSKQEEQGDREQWPWLPGTIVEQCGPEEWYVCVEVRELAVLRDGRRAPRGTASRNLCYPCCFRDRSKIRPRTASSGAASATRPGAGGNRDRDRRPSPDSQCPLVTDLRLFSASAGRWRP